VGSGEVLLTAERDTLRMAERPLVMGVLNVTPDSFWDGGRYAAPEAAIEHARRMVDDGADIIDIGAESTRPGSNALDLETEIDRLTPVVSALDQILDVPISIDTRRAAVAGAMLDLGADMVNDVSGLAFDSEMARVVCDYGVPVVIMHMRGRPDDMQSHTDYVDVVADVKRELAERVARAEQNGIAPDRIIIDPGIGFAKTAEQCVEIIARLDEFLDLGKPVLIGPSRKSFMGKILGLAPEDRLEATIACAVVAAVKGAAIVRVHDVASTVKALSMLAEISSRAKTADDGVANPWD
jgi:dihydropteroate synthase